MPTYVIFAALAVSASVPVLWWAVASSREPGSAAVARNLAAGQPHLIDLRRALLEKSAHERAVAPAVAALARRTRKLTPVGMVELLERRLRLSGETWSIERVLATKFGLGVVGGMVGFMTWAGNPTTLNMMLFVFLTGVGFFGPDVVLGGRAEKRQKTINNELPDTLDQVTISVEAGLGFEAALARVAQTGTGPLAQELARTLQDIRFGIPRMEAMDRLLERTDSPDLQRFVHAMRQAEGYGIPISQALRAQSAEQRDKRRQRAEERAMKLPVKVIFPLIFCILPTLFIVIMGPIAVRFVSGELFPS